MERGCFGSAWDDVKGTEGWLGKMALMALIQLVPILNWVNTGYAWNWTRQLVAGRREGFSGSIVTGENFKMGFYIFVLGLVAGIVVGVEAYVLVLLPAAGGRRSAGALVIVMMLVVIVLAVFAVMFVGLAIGRLSVLGSLGAGFQVGKVMEAYRRNMGTLFAVSWLPVIVGGLIAFVIELVFGLMIGAVVGGSMMGVIGYAANNPRYSANVLASVMASGGFVYLLLTLLMQYCVNIVSVFISFVAARGIGHYIVRFVPDWVEEARAAENGAFASFGATAAGAAAGMGANVAAGGAAGVAGGAVAAGGVANSAASAAEAPAASYAAPVSGAVGVITPNSSQVSPELAASAAAGAPVAGAAAPAAAGAGAPTAAGTGVPASEAFPAMPLPNSQPTVYDAPTVDPFDVYAFSETSVLPEEPEDMDTIVQPELAAPVAAEPAAPVAAVAPAAQVAAGQAVSAAPVATADAVRLQPTASGPLDGEGSDTLVLTGGQVVAQPAQSQPAYAPESHQASLQLSRANGDTCVLAVYPTVIGKGVDADLVIEGNSAVSRHHVRILRDGNVFAVEDLGSTNKTFIGSYELPPHTPTILSDGDVLKLGNEVLRVKVV